MNLLVHRKIPSGLKHIRENTTEEDKTKSIKTRHDCEKKLHYFITPDVLNQETA